MAIKPIIESMITKANETTGKSDADLTVAMQSLIDGYGQGGSSGGGLPDTVEAGDTPVVSSAKLVTTLATVDNTATGISVIVPKSGTYRFKFSCGRTNTTGDWTTQLYKNGVAVSGATVMWNSYQGSCTADISCDAGDSIEIYGFTRGTNYRSIIGQLVGCINMQY